MRKNKLTVIMLVLIACSANGLSSVTSTADSNSISDIPTSAPASTSSFTEPDPETFVAVMPALREYFYYRKQAIITGNIEELWTHFPELKNEVSIEQGINSEEFIVTNYQSLKPFDGNIFPEYYERFRVKFTNGQVEVLVHGMELYTWLDENNKFEDSGGEFKIVLYLRMKNGHWVVYKTDEVTMSEWQQFSP